MVSRLHTELGQAASTQVDQNAKYSVGVPLVSTDPFGSEIGLVGIFLAASSLHLQKSVELGVCHDDSGFEFLDV